MMEILVLLANGCEEVEALAVVDLLKRAEISVCMASITGDKKIVGSHGITFWADHLLQDVLNKEYAGVFLPGGMPGAEKLGNDPNVLMQLRKMNQKELLISAICAAPVVLEKAGILSGKRVTCYPGFEQRFQDGTVVDANVVKDGHVITGRSVGAAFELGLKLIEFLKGKEMSDSIRRQCLIEETVQ